MSQLKLRLFFQFLRTSSNLLSGGKMESSNNTCILEKKKNYSFLICNVGLLYHILEYHYDNY